MLAKIRMLGYNSVYALTLAVYSETRGKQDAVTAAILESLSRSALDTRRPRSGANPEEQFRRFGAKGKSLSSPSGAVGRREIALDVLWRTEA